MTFGGRRRLIDEAFGHARVDVAAKRPPHLFLLTQLADHAIECSRQLADLIAGDDIDGSIELARLDVARALQQQPDRARDPAADQACEQQSQDCGYGGDNDRDPDRPLLIDHNRCSAGVDLGQHIRADLINLLVELVSEGINPLERALNLRKVVRLELADESAIFFVQEPSNIRYGSFYPAVDVRQRHIVRRGAGVLDDRVDEFACGLGFFRNLGVFGPIDLHALCKSRVIRRRLHLGDNHLTQREGALERSHVRARQVPIGRDIFIGQLVQQMTDPIRHQR